MRGWFRSSVAAVVGLCVAIAGLAGTGGSAAAAGSLTVEPSGVERPAFLSGPVALLADLGVVVGRNTTVMGGATVVRAADAGSYLPSARTVVAVDRDARLDAVAGDSVELGRGTTVADLATNSVAPGGVATGQVTALGVPVDVAFPAPAPVTPGTVAVSVPRDMVRELAPGSYGALTVGRNSTVRLADGDYVFSSLSIDRDTTVVTGQHTTITVTGTASVERNVRLGDLDGDTTALTVIVLGTDTAAAAALSIDRDTQLGATLVVPNGTLAIGRNTRLVGSATARWVAIDRDCQITYRAGQAPVASLAAGVVEPLDGSTVHGEVVLRAEETTGAHIAQVTYLVDGAVVGTATTAPFTLTWDTAGATDTVQVTAVVSDVDGTTITTDPISLRIAPAGTTDEARLQADLDNGVLTPEDFTRHAVYRWMHPANLPPGYVLPAQYQVIEDADDGRVNITPEMIWATHLIDQIDPDVRAEVYLRLGVTDPDEVHETLRPNDVEQLIGPLLDNPHLYTDALAARGGLTTGDIRSSEVFSPGLLV